MAKKMKDSGIEWIGEIPEDWDVVRIRHKARVASSGLSLDKLLEYGQFAVYDANNLVGYIDENPVKDDYISIIKDGAGVGRTRLMPKNTNVIGTMNYIVANKIDLSYLFYALQVFDFEQYSTGSTIPHIYFKDYGNEYIALPNQEIQEDIVKILNYKVRKIYRLMDRVSEQIQTLEDYKKSVITEAVTKGLDKNVEMKDSGIEWIGEIPEHWKVIRIKNTALLKARIGWQGLKSDEFLDDINLPYLVTGTDFKDGFVDWENCVRISEQRFEMDKNIQIKENDLLITKDGTIGKLAISKNCPCKASLNSGVFVIRNNGPYKYCDKYMYYLLQSEQFLLWFELNDAGNSTIRHLYQKDFYNFSFTYPEEQEQEKIALYLDKKTKIIDEAICSKQKQLETLEEYKKSLIYEYVTGKKEVE